jgi:hypothetical protein
MSHLPNIIQTAVAVIQLVLWVIAIVHGGPAALVGGLLLAHSWPVMPIRVD